jgi:hypothetical protein
MSNNISCSTCSHSTLDTNYYSKYKVPLYIQPLFKSFVESVITSTCLNCSQPLLKTGISVNKDIVDEKILKLTGAERLKTIAKLSKNIKCSCGGQKIERDLREIKEKLLELSNEDLEFYGFKNKANPADFITDHMPVPPPMVLRPGQKDPT